MNYPLPKPAQKSFWTALSSGSLSYLLTEHLPKHQTKIILTKDSETAQRLQAEWQFFRPNDVALFFPRLGNAAV